MRLSIADRRGRLGAQDYPRSEAARLEPTICDGIRRAHRGCGRWNHRCVCGRRGYRSVCCATKRGEGDLLARSPTLVAGVLDEVGRVLLYAYSAYGGISRAHSAEDYVEG